MITGKRYNKKFKFHLGEGGSQAHRYCHMNGGPWCCAQVSLVYKETDKRLFYGGKYCTYCPNAMYWCRANLAEVPLYLALPGDIIFFDWNGNNVPDHIGEVDHKINTSKIATVEGNTGSPARVRKRTRPAKYVIGIYRPLYVPDKELSKGKLTIDGDFGFHSIYMLQIALGLKPTGILTKATVKALQKKVGAKPDGAWGKNTSKKVQKFIGATQDGDFYKKSVMALQRWINVKVYGKSKKKSVSNKSVTVSKPSAEAKKAVAWAKKIAKNGGYTYKKFKVHNKKTKQCPICHKLKGKYKGWNCIGFVSAAFHHGAGLKSVKCACNGIGTDGWFNKVTLASWEKRNGKGWKIVTNGGKKGGADIPTSKLVAGDALICYDSKGKFHHIALYIGNSKYIDCTNTSKNHIAERPYSRLTKRYHVTRAFRYVGK